MVLSILQARAAGSCEAGSCSCEGNWIGDACDVECKCGEHGTFVDAVAASAAGFCSAGRRVFIEK